MIPTYNNELLALDLSENTIKLSHTSLMYWTVLCMNISSNAVDDLSQYIFRKHQHIHLLDISNNLITEVKTYAF